MSIVDLHKDLDAGTLTIVTEYAASVERVWQLWADPRQLERWWGPPMFPATVTDHELVPGGLVLYYMTGPEGKRHHGGWRVVTVERPRRLEFEDFFVDADGAENTKLPVSRTGVSIADAGAMTQMTLMTRYSSTAAMQQVLEMGMEEGIRQALGQIEGILASEAV